MGFSSVEVNSDKQSSLLGNEKQEQSYNLRDGVSSTYFLEQLTSFTFLITNCSTDDKTNF